MAINVVNSQGVKLWITKPPATPWSTCSEAVSALQGSTAIVCPQSIGDLAESRGVTEYKCMSSNETTKALGAVSREAFDIGLLFDAGNAGGQKMLRTSFIDGKPLVLGIEIPNELMLYFPIMVSKQATGVEQDSAVMSTFTVEISGDIMECSLSQAQTHPVVNNSVAVVNNGIPVVNTH